MPLAGKWKKVSTSQCDEQYPAEIEFSEQRPRYLAKKGTGQGFISWDAGTYEVMRKDQVKISTATDAQILYRFTITGDTLTFTDPDGCEFKYRRVD